MPHSVFVLTAKTIAAALRAVIALAQPLVDDAYPEQTMTVENVAVERENAYAWINIDTTDEDGVSYNNRVWADATDGGLIICEAYVKNGAKWSLLFTDEACTELPTLREPSRDETSNRPGVCSIEIHTVCEPRKETIMKTTTPAITFVPATTAPTAPDQYDIDTFRAGYDAMVEDCRELTGDDLVIGEDDAHEACDAFLAAAFEAGLLDEDHDLEHLGGRFLYDRTGEGAGTFKDEETLTEDHGEALHQLAQKWFTC